MDAAKAVRLHEMGYVVQACGLCMHADLAPGVDWGTCRANTYAHGKHSGDPRQVSINRHGRCPAFSVSDAARAELHGFGEFVATPVERE